MSRTKSHVRFAEIRLSTFLVVRVSLTLTDMVRPDRLRSKSPGPKLIKKVVNRDRSPSVPLMPPAPGTPIGVDIPSPHTPEGLGDPMFVEPSAKAKPRSTSRTASEPEPATTCFGDKSDNEKSVEESGSSRGAHHRRSASASRSKGQSRWQSSSSWDMPSGQLQSSWKRSTTPRPKRNSTAAAADDKSETGSRTGNDDKLPSCFDIMEQMGIGEQAIKVRLIARLRTRCLMNTCVCDSVCCRCLNNMPRRS